MRFSTILLALAMVGCRKPAVDEDADGSIAGVDCNDADDAILPGAVETCNGVDDNCNGTLDDGASDATKFYADFDGDGYGSDQVTLAACAPPAGYVAEATDCNDADAAIFPGAAEACELPIDNNCDGSVGYADVDGDGFPACKDCNDTSATISPAALEQCNDADDDCDGTVDNDAVDVTTYFADKDGDDFGDADDSVQGCEAPADYVADADDCDDGAKDVHPGAGETCNTTDDNCNGVVDEAASDAITYYLDADGDGQGNPAISQKACAAPNGYVTDKQDCDDLEAKSFVGASEACDGLDNDCLGGVPTNEVDGDTDGWFGCEGDCDDASTVSNPVEPEVCDGLDNNCDGQVDAAAIDAKVWFKDVDADGYGDPTVTTTACAAPAGFASKGTDCNDAAGNVHPSAPRACDNKDHDCDGSVDYDADDDGRSSAACGGSDCDETNPTLPDAKGFCSYTSCKSVLAAGWATSGAYPIDLDGTEVLEAPHTQWCDLTTAGGGWTVVTNNYNSDVEPAGCYARVASDPSLVCGPVIAPTADFAIHTKGLAFKEALWVAYSGTSFSNAVAYSYMQWTAAVSFPASAAPWNLPVQTVGATLPAFSTLPLILGCPGAVSAIQNENTHNTGGSSAYPLTAIVTTFPTNTAGSQHLGFTDDRDHSFPTIPNISNMSGLEDFQDGWACSDVWSPQSARGASSYLMVR